MIPSPVDDLERLSARMRELEKAVEELAADNRDLHAQLAVVVSALESAVGAPSSGSTTARPITVDADELAPREGPSRAPVMRAAKALIRTTLGVARRIWRAADPDLGIDVYGRLDDGHAGPLPRVAFVAVDGDEAGVRRVREALGAQTDDGFVVACWDRRSNGYRVEDAADGELACGSADDARELVAVLDAEVVIDAALLPPRLAPTFVETLRWLLACEGLHVVRLLDPGAGHELRAVGREVWQPGGVDLEALQKLAARVGRAVLGKTVVRGGGAAYHLPDRAPLGAGTGRVVCDNGAYLLPHGLQPGALTHRMRRPGPPAAPDADPDGRPTVLVLVTAPLVGGLEQRLANLLRLLGVDYRFVVAAVPVQGPPTGARLDGLSRLVPHVYPIGELFADELWPTVLEHVLGRYEVKTLLHIGDDPWFGAVVSDLRSRFPYLRVVNQAARMAGASSDALPAGVVDLHVAVTSEIEQRLIHESSIDPDRLVRVPAAASWSLPPDRSPAPEGVRAELGVRDGEVLVVMVADLIPETRPEDFVAVASRFRDDEGYRFVLVGDGPLAATVTDLRRFFGLDRFALRPPRHSAAEIVDAADVVCSTAESESSPVALLAAVAAGRSVVAAAVDDVRELFESYPGAAVAVPLPGDLAAFEAAIRSLATGQSCPPADEARQSLDRDFGEAVALYRRALRPGDG